jgi:hypothetical protein
VRRKSRSDVPVIDLNDAPFLKVFRSFLEDPMAMLL